ncbi:MAG: hypothetical protein JWP25_7562 [Bradyrhizobium sp.]|nr:hypothetical protein [Bradyrhizobium sp.]
MKVTIVRPDNVVIVDGRAMRVDCGTLPDYVRIVQWDEDHGHVEMFPYGSEFVPSIDIENLDDFRDAIAAWQAAANLIDNPPPPPPPTKEQLTKYAAVRRLAKEVGGFVDPAFGSLSTDRDTRAIVGQSIQSIDLGIVAEPVNFKIPSGFASLTRADFIAIAKVTAAFVQSTFDLEATVTRDINSGTITTNAQIDAAFSA